MIADPAPAPPPPIIRTATVADVPQIAALAAQRRRDYARHQPVFWHPASDGLARHLPYLEHQIASSDVLAFVHQSGEQMDGFIIGRVGPAPPVYDPGGPVCVVDDFVVADVERWIEIGSALLRQVEAAAHRERGCALVIVVCGDHDRPKQELLHRDGARIASQWWVKTLRS